MIHNTTTQTFDNTTIVEFLAANQPDLIKQWHAHTGINALKQLAEEYGEKPAPEPTPKMIDERLVYCHLDSLAKMFDEPDLWGLPDDMTAEKFFNQGGNAIQKFLFQSWTDHKEFLDDEMWLSPFDAEVAA
jgi:hypothetical protein